MTAGAIMSAIVAALVLAPVVVGVALLGKWAGGRIGARRQAAAEAYWMAVGREQRARDRG